MYKEIEIPRTELKPLAKDLSRIFIQRGDLYPRQLDDGSYICVRKPLKLWHLVAHLKGEITLGTYVLDQESRARFIAIDADDDHEMEGLYTMASDLAAEGVTAYLETSRRGGHLWLFFAQPVLGKDARAFGRGLLAAHNLDEIELFPKQSRLKTGPGSLIRLPFGFHRKSGLRYGFFTVDGLPLAKTLWDQIRVLSAPQVVPEAAFEAFRSRASRSRRKTVSRRSESPEGTLSERIKDSVTVLDFVGQYVELSPNGRGLCPFHDDRRSSFSVNAEQNYWYCFAGCGGGSVIDFWMKYRDCDFKTAIKELAQTLKLK